MPRRFLVLPTTALAAIVLVLGSAAASRAQTASSSGPPPPELIPMPRRVEATGQRFALGRGARIELAEPTSSEDAFAARDFIADTRATSGVRLALRGESRRRILVGPLSSRAVRAALRRAGVDVPADLNAEGYALAVTAREIVVGGASAAGTFYGLQTLKQLIRGDSARAWVPGVRIVDWPAMRWRGLSYDISRGPVPTLAYMERQVRTMAALKMNMYSLYMEHTFVSASHPLIAPEGGAITPAEARTLVAYAHRYHMEVVPELQTFGHLHKVLRLERYDSIAEVPFGDVVTPERAGTYTLIGDRYRELAAAFPGRFFHIGEDETFELGQGQSKLEVQQKGEGAVYMEHLNRVRNMLKPYGRTLMFWGDIALRHPDLLGEIPKDMIVVNWNYAPRDSFTTSIEPFEHAGLKQMVAPGVQSWSQIFPNENAAVVNIRNFVRDGQAASDVIGMLNTEWADDGEALFQMAWYGVGLGAAASWQPAPLDTVAFDSAFDWAFFRARGHAITTAIRELGSISDLLGLGATDPVFWRNPFTDSYQMLARRMADTVRIMRLRVEDAEAKAIRAEGRAHRNADVLEDVRFAGRRFDHMGLAMEMMVQFSKDYWAAYDAPTNRALVGHLGAYSGLIYNRLREMAEDLSGLRQEYGRLWLTENRPYWLHSIQARYDLAILQWLRRSRDLSQILRAYHRTGTLPAPSTFGLGPDPSASTSH